MNINRCYSELQKLTSFKERFNYLQLNGVVGFDTFGNSRYLNQILYHTLEWKKVRDIVIMRDKGCDLGMDGYEIHGAIIIHHMNPITIEQVMKRDPIIFDPEFLITTRHKTHNAIHYSDESQLTFQPIERSKNDTCPWRI